eukprot:TRINITY_DN120896_c0_g1_i1.p1 TRINITY_DN120896_c0_g1~~TRINITY_DN120896_c0_g1_i1.p1  ORF type:complete len:777 (-),score=161.43 TRINITY_DN120896_c0_g1_i1:117-2447(-)
MPGSNAEARMLANFRLPASSPPTAYSRTRLHSAGRTGASAASSEKTLPSKGNIKKAREDSSDDDDLDIGRLHLAPRPLSQRRAKAHSRTVTHDTPTALSQRRPRPPPTPLDSVVAAPSITHGGSSSSSSASKAKATGDATNIGGLAAVAAVIQDMLQLKYGLSLDEADLLRKLEVHCRTKKDGHHGSEDPESVVAALNAYPDLQFRARDGHFLVTLRLESHRLLDFRELSREIQRMPGTARAVAVVGGASPDASWEASGCSASYAVAVFRPGYTAPKSSVVGRAFAPCSPPLLPVNANNLHTAILLDPCVLQLLQCSRSTGDLVASPTPPVLEEYTALGAWVYGDEASRGTPEAADVRRMGVQSPRAHQQLHLEVAPPPMPQPSQEWGRTVKGMLEQPDAGGEVLQPLEQLVGWLGGLHGKEMQSRAAACVDSCKLHCGLVAAVQRAGLRRNGGSPVVEMNVGMQAARAIGLAVIEAPSSRQKYGQFGIVGSLCSVMRAWPESADMQQAAVFTLRQFLGAPVTGSWSRSSFDNGAAGSSSQQPCDVEAVREALQHDAPTLIGEAVRLHPGLVDIQGNGAKAMQAMASCQEEWAHYHGSRGAAGEPAAVAAAPPGSYPVLQPAPLQVQGGLASGFGMAVPLLGCGAPPPQSQPPQHRLHVPAGLPMPSPALTPPPLLMPPQGLVAMQPPLGSGHQIPQPMTPGTPHGPGHGASWPFPVGGQTGPFIPPQALGMAAASPVHAVPRPEPLTAGWAQHLPTATTSIGSAASSRPPPSPPR